MAIIPIEYARMRRRRAAKEKIERLLFVFSIWQWRRRRQYTPVNCQVGLWPQSLTQEQGHKLAGGIKAIIHADRISQ